MNPGPEYTTVFTATRTAEFWELLVSLAKKAAVGILLATLVAAASARDTQAPVPPVSGKSADSRQAAGKPASQSNWTIHYRVR